MKRLVIPIAGFMLAMLLFAAPAQADFRITVDGITYEGDYSEKGVNYIVNGKIVASLRPGKDQDHTEIVDTNGNLIGSAVYSSRGWDYFDRYGNPAGTAESIPPPNNLNGPRAIYRDRLGNVIGYAREEGCYRLNFLDANHNVIGAEVGSNALPMRPIPLEIWLRMRK